jgi:hypothetical protein
MSRSPTILASQNALAAATSRTYRLIGPADSGKIEDLLEGKSDKEARQRLQALISQWLRMENLVVLTGAGCSHSSGGKLINNLEAAASETVLAIPKLSDAVSTLLKERIKPFDQRETWARTGFEDWLSYLANAVHLASKEDSPFSGIAWKANVTPTGDDLAHLVRSLGHAIVAECTLRLPQSDGTTGSAIPPHLAFLSKLVVRDSNLGRTHLFTLNYDTLFEQAMELLGIQYFDGFTGRADARFDPSVYGLDIYYPGEVAEGRVRRFDKFMHFYKLHGSIHWHVDNGELRARHPDLRAYQGYSSLSANQKEKFLAKFNPTQDAVGILPTANKFVQTLTMPFAHLFRSFQIRLSAPQTFLLVLGYGFGDDHVTRIIETALMNPSLVMLVVEPNPNSPTLERIRRYKDLGKRAFLLTATDEAFAVEPFATANFDDFAKNIMPDVQWLDDFMRLRRFERQILSNIDTPTAEPEEL